MLLGKPPSDHGGNDCSICEQQSYLFGSVYMFKKEDIFIDKIHVLLVDVDATSMTWRAVKNMVI